MNFHFYLSDRSPVSDCLFEFSHLFINLYPLQFHEELQLRLDEASRVGYGFVLPASEDVSVVPIVPKSQQENGREVAA